MDWWQQLAQKERGMLTLTGAFLLAFVCWLGVWRPMEKLRQNAVVQLERQQSEIQWMRSAASEVARLTARRPTGQQNRGQQSLLALAEQTARQAGLGSAFRRGEPAGNGQVRVWLEGASFEALLGWLDKLDSNQGVRVLDSDPERTGMPGMVTVRLLLAEG
jgi:general secretion pathway protein M